MSTSFWSTVVMSLQKVTKKVTTFLLVTLWNRLVNALIRDESHSAVTFRQRTWYSKHRSFSHQFDWEWNKLQSTNLSRWTWTERRSLSLFPPNWSRMFLQWAVALSPWAVVTWFAMKNTSTVWGRFLFLLLQYKEELSAFTGLISRFEPREIYM